MTTSQAVRSVSQVELYEKCGYRYYLQRVERVPPRPAAWAYQGVAVHAAVEAVERSGRTMGAEEAVAVFSDRYSELVNAWLKVEPNTEKWLWAGKPKGALPGWSDIEHRYHVGQEQTRKYVEWTNVNQPDIWTTPTGKLALELHFQVEIGGVPVQGYIDQVIIEPEQDSLRVRDVKTGSTKSQFQLEVYKIGVERLYDVPVNRGDWYLAKEGRLSRPVELDKVSEDEVGERIAAMDDAVKRGDFPAKPGYSCRFCDVSHACSFASDFAIMQDVA